MEACFAATTRLRLLVGRWLDAARSWPDFAGPPDPIQLSITGIRAEGWHGSIPRARDGGGLGFLPDRTPEQARAEIEAAVVSAAGGTPLAVTWHGIHNDAYLGSADGITEARLCRAAARHGGSPTRAWRVSCDATGCTACVGGLETVIFGSGDLAVAHSDREAITVDEVERGIAILVTIYPRPRRRRVQESGEPSDVAELSEELSPHAWMSVRDGELIRAVLLNMAGSRYGQPLRILEWQGRPRCAVLLGDSRAHGHALPLGGP